MSFVDSFPHAAIELHDGIRQIGPNRELTVLSDPIKHMYATHHACCSSKSVVLNDMPGTDGNVPTLCCGDDRCNTACGKGASKDNEPRSCSQVAMVPQPQRAAASDVATESSSTSSGSPPQLAAGRPLASQHSYMVSQSCMAFEIGGSHGERRKIFELNLEDLDRYCIAGA